MALLFLIPFSMISSLIEERSLSQSEVTSEITEKWGRNQTLAGPMLVVPYLKKVPKISEDNSKEKWVYKTEYAYFFPEEINAEIDVKTEIRKRSIYEIPLYTNKINIKGNFEGLNQSNFPSDVDYIYYDEAKLVISVSDVVGIGGDIRFLWNQKELGVLPGTKSNFFSNGLHIPISSLRNQNKHSFELTFTLKGSNQFSFVPLGKSNQWSVHADWKDPSFSGAILPSDREITETGFRAVWESSYYGRNFPQSFDSLDSYSANLILSSGSGFELAMPVNHYHTIQRSTKYGLLIVVISFTIFFLMEILGGVILHPIQYVLIGAAMSLFYILNLSLSEHIGFTFSYMIASLSVTSLICYYSQSVLKNRIKGLYTGIYYFILYSFMYVVLDSEENSLLLGSIALFIVLGLVMHLTRKIDWYQFGNKSFE